MEERKDAYRVLVKKPGERRPLGRLKRDGTIILKWILKRWDGEHGLSRSGSG
jgi:hypothetical protein